MDSIKKLTDLFARFPTIGSRTAGRFVMYLINQPESTSQELIKAIQELKQNIKLCGLCFNPFEPPFVAEAPQGETQNNLCFICQNPSRQQNILCIVEKEADLASIENTKKYKGLYFILGGTLTIRKSDGSNLRIEPLKNRIKNGNFSEIIVALNPTPEGRSTSVLVERAIRELPQFSSLRITHLAKGLPVGGELEYADEETLESAFMGRR